MITFMLGMLAGAALVIGLEAAAFYALYRSAYPHRYPVDGEET